MAFVNYQEANDDTVALTTFPLPSIDAVSGNVLVVHMHFYSTADRTFTCAGGGLTWNVDSGGSSYNADDDWGTRVWYAEATSTTGVVATIDNALQGTSFIAGAILQYDSYSSWIGSVTNRQTAPGTGANGVTSGVLDITSQPARQIGTFLNYPAASPPTPIGTVRIAGWSSGYGVVSDRQITSTGNSAATATAAGGQGSATHYSVQSSFAETGGGGGATIVNRESIRRGIGRGIMRGM